MTTACDKTDKAVEYTVPIGTAMGRFIDMLIVHVLTERKENWTADGETSYTFTKDEKDEPIPLSVSTTLRAEPYYRLINRIIVVSRRSRYIPSGRSKIADDLSGTPMST